MKRFYKAVQTTESKGVWHVELDGRAVKTPSKASLGLPSQALAQAIAQEWRAQGETVQPETMALTQIACSAIDRVAPARAQVIEGVSAFAETDLLCYPAASPPELRAAQDRAWLPLLATLAQHDWHLVQTDALRAIAQDPAVRPRARAWLETLEPFALTAIASLIEASGSFFLSYALATGLLDLPRLLTACTVEERYALKAWGSDAEAEQLLARREADLATFAQMLDLLG